MIKPGIYPHLSNEDYHTDPAISRSGIVTYLDSPYKYWGKYINPERPQFEQTDAMIFGSAFHSLVLEPEIFDITYIMKPQKVLLKDVGEELYRKYKNVCDYIENHDTLITLSFEEFNTLCRMRDAILNHETAHNLIQSAAYETSYFWEDKHSGLMIKSRPDILHENMIVDLKTCNEASPRAFQKDMALYGNYIQGAMVRDGVYECSGNKINTVINICIEKKYPYAIGIYKIDEAALDYGHSVYKQALLDIKRDIGYNKFESYPIETIGLPAWAIK